MSGITIKFVHERRVAIDDNPLSANNFRADILLTPDGDINLSREYGYLRLTVEGDSSKVPDLKLSELETWLKDGIVKMLQSAPSPAE